MVSRYLLQKASLQMIETPASSSPSSSQSAPVRRSGLDHLLIASVILVLVGGGFALWKANGVSVFAEALTGLWALCF